MASFFAWAFLKAGREEAESSGFAALSVFPWRKIRQKQEIFSYSWQNLENQTPRATLARECPVNRL
jgi:hypothetical protein